MADAIPPIKVSVVADTSGLKTGVDQATKGIKEIENSVKTASTGMSGFVTKLKQVGSTLGVVFAGQQIVSFFKESVAASLEAEAAQARLRNLLLNTNGATEEQIKALSAQAKALEKVGVVSADNVTVTQSQLATFDLSANAISKLTPAILDYVTAEKGASAGAEEFKGMTNSLAQALQGNFASLTKVGFVLDDATKKQISHGTEMERAAALVEVLNSTYKDFNKNLRETSAGGLQVAINDFNNLKQQIGDSLQPVIDAFANFLSGVLFPVLSKLVEFLTKNKDTIIALAKTIGIGVVAFTAYKTILIVTTAASKAFAVMQVILKGQQLATIASTNGLAASMLALNAVMRANVVGIIITAVAALIGLMVHLYQHNMKVRNIILDVGIAGIKAFAALIEWTGKLVTGILKLETGPLRALLKGLSFLKVPGTKEALNGLNSAIDSVGNFFDSAAKKVEGYTLKLEQAKRATNNYGKQTVDTVKKNVVVPKVEAPAGLDSKVQKKLDDYVKKAKDIQKDMQDVIDAANEKALEALNTRNEKMADANQNYLEKEADLRKNYEETMAEALKTYNEKVFDINKTYDEKEADLLKNKNAKLDELQAKAEEKRTELIKSAAEKRQSIIQQSIDRLRDAFASKTGFDIADAFGGGATTGKGLLEKLRGNLKAAKDLQANAGALAAQGYSQTFIEQVVKQGPEVGNKIAQALKDSTPEETKALQDAFKEMESVQNNGLDALAKSMNAGAKLATDELRNAYEQVAVDLKNDLSTVDAELKKSMAEANANYSEAMTKTKKDRDEALADALKTWTEAKAKAQKILDEGLADAQKSLTDALTKAQTEYEKAIDEINKATQKKLEELQAKLNEILALIAAISAATAALTAGGTPTYTPIVPVNPADVNKGMTQAQLDLERARESGKFQVNIYAKTDAKPDDIGKIVTTQMKYGEVVRIAGRLGTALMPE